MYIYICYIYTAHCFIYIYIYILISNFFTVHFDHAIAYSVKLMYDDLVE